MIAIYDFLWKRLEDYGKKFQSGQDVVDEFNGKIAEIQLEVINDLSPFYQTNELVRGVLDVWTRKIDATSPSTGTIVRPVVGAEVFMRVISMGVLDADNKYDYEIVQYVETELAIANRIPQRRPSVANKVVCYVPYNKVIQLYPEQAIKYRMYYFIYPTLARIAFTYTSTADEDVMTYDAGGSIQLAWDESASNIILYKLLEKYGIANRELWLSEYAKLGVNTSLGGQQQ